jgi:hypothetical protein
LKAATAYFLLVYFALGAARAVDAVFLLGWCTLGGMLSIGKWGVGKPAPAKIDAS